MGSRCHADDALWPDPDRDRRAGIPLKAEPPPPPTPPPGARDHRRWPWSFGIRGHLLLAFSAIVGLTALIALFSWQAFHVLDTAMGALAFRAMPAQVTGQQIADGVASLMNPVQSLAHADTADELGKWQDMAKGQMADLGHLRARLGNLVKARQDDETQGAIGQLDRALADLASRIATLEASAASRISWSQARGAADLRAVGAHARFLEAARDLERFTRGQANLALSTRLIEAGDRESLQTAIAVFVENEMNWLGTAQELRSEAGELLATMSAAASEETEGRLERLKRQASLGAIRLAMARRLPKSQPLDRIIRSADGLVASATGPDNVFDLRHAELVGRRDVATALAAAAEAVNGSRDAAARLVQGLNDRVGRLVAATNARIAVSAKVLGLLALLAALGAAVVVRYYVDRRLVSRLLRLEGHMRAATARPVAPAEVAAWSRAVAGGGRDEIATMAEAMLVFVDTIAQREAALLDARRQAEEATQAKSRFLANMSHEIRTPITAIMGFTQLALKNHASPKLREYLGKTQSSAAALLEMIGNVLDFSKIEAGKLAVERVDFDLHAVLRRVMEVVSLKAEEKRLELAVSVAPEVPVGLVGDPLRLGQILLNLVNNAVKFTERGEVVVAVALAARDEDGVDLRFSVRDTGIGISEAVQGRLFQPFDQADTSTTRRYGGTGLGLAISRDLVELMGGRIGIVSEPGRGSTFTFTVRLGTAGPGIGAPTSQPFALNDVPPLDPLIADGNAASRAVPEVPAFLRGRRVLLAEDNDYIREFERDFLKGLGLEVVVAVDGREAVAMALDPDLAFDLVLMDVQMPEMDGLAATRAIRKRRGPQELPIVAMTAHAMESERRRCLEAGMNEHLSKPVEPQALVAVLARLLAPAEAATPLPSAVGVAAAMPPLPGVDLAGLLARVGGKSEVAVKLIVGFPERFGDTVARLRALLAAGERSPALRVAHSFRGAAATLGAAGIAGEAGTIEEALAQGDAGTAAKALDRLEGDLAALLAAIAGSYPGGTGESAPAAAGAGAGAAGAGGSRGGRDALLHQLDDLDSLLAENKLSARKLFAVVGEDLRRLGLADGLAPLAAALERLDYGAARHALRRLRQTLASATALEASGEDR